MDYQRFPPYFYMRLVHFILLLSVIFFYGCVSNRAATKNFSNMTYFVKDEGGKRKATLVDGGYGEPEFAVDYDNRYVFGDFNHDGLRDAAVIIIESTGGSSSIYLLAFLINNGKELVHEASQDLESDAIINSMKEQNGKVLVDMFIHKEGDSKAQPTKRVKNLYGYTGPQFEKLRIINSQYLPLVTNLAL